MLSWSQGCGRWGEADPSSSARRAFLTAGRLLWGGVPPAWRPGRERGLRASPLGLERRVGGERQVQR
jgi:hypothetical protein